MCRCQACGSTYGVQEHHIIFRSTFGKNKRKEQEATDNKVYLCEKHHSEIHARKLFILKRPNGSIHFVSKDILEKLKQWKNFAEKVGQLEVLNSTKTDLRPNT